MQSFVLNVNEPRPLSYAEREATLLTLASHIYISQSIDAAPRHRSNAEEMIARVAVIEVAGAVAMCDGGTCRM